MYFVGKLIRALNAKEAVNEAVCIRFTRRGADKACIDGTFFYVRQRRGIIPPDAEPIFPRRIR